MFEDGLEGLVSVEARESSAPPMSRCLYEEKMIVLNLQLGQQHVLKFFDSSS